MWIDCHPGLASVQGSRDGTRPARYDNALGSARGWRTWRAATAIGYLEPIDKELRGRCNHIIGTLVRLVR